MLAVDARSLRQYKKDIAREAAKIGDPKQRRKIMVKGAREVVKIGQQKVPVDEGIVKKSIKVLREKKSQPGTYVGPQVSTRTLKETGRPTNLPLMIEYGTVHIGPRPYMRPAAEQGIPKALTVIEAEMKKLVK